VVAAVKEGADDQLLVEVRGKLINRDALLETTFLSHFKTKKFERKKD